jgi:hypothetical protein
MISPVDVTLGKVDQGIDAAASIVANIPVYGQLIAGVLEVGKAIVNAIGIRSGADEADVITKVQTPLGNQLIAINAAIPYATPTQLATMFQAVYQMGEQFRRFVGSSVFTDGRASTQALNTIMPLIDGTGDYTSKDSNPGCQHCGPEGGGEDGILGSISRQLGMSGFIMAAPQVTQGATAGYFPSLESPTMNYGDTIPQAGTLPNFPPSTIQGTAPQVVSTGLFDAGYVPLFVGAALLWLFIRRRG